MLKEKKMNHSSKEKFEKFVKKNLKINLGQIKNIKSEIIFIIQENIEVLHIVYRI